jgi:hypothetical protein
MYILNIVFLSVSCYYWRPFVHVPSSTAIIIIAQWARVPRWRTTQSWRRSSGISGMLCQLAEILSDVYQIYHFLLYSCRLIYYWRGQDVVHCTVSLINVFLNIVSGISHPMFFVPRTMRPWPMCLDPGQIMPTAPPPHHRKGWIVWGCIGQGMHQPRDASSKRRISSKGHIVQVTHDSRKNIRSKKTLCMWALL